jgi:hypothetical protein
VIAIDGTTVTVRGVNPPTGKNISFEWPDIKNKEALPTFRAAMRSRTLYKVLMGNSSEGIHLEQEELLHSAKDSYFTILTYCSKIGYNPLFLRELQEYTLIMDSTTTLNSIGLHVLNAIEKLGNIFYAIDEVTRLNQQKYLYREIRYHVFNAIVSCKASFDALATILNEVYSIGYTKGKIDLATSRSDLINKVSSINAILARKLRKYEGWINKITDYRDFVVHRIMIVTPPMSSRDPSAKNANKVRCKVPIRPLGLNDSDERVTLIDAEDFCENLSITLQELIEIVCLDLLTQIRARRYFPT